MYTLVWLKERETERGGGGRKREREKGREEGRKGESDRGREGNRERAAVNRTSSNAKSHGGVAHLALHPRHYRGSTHSARCRTHLTQPNPNLA